VKTKEEEGKENEECNKIGKEIGGKDSEGWKLRRVKERTHILSAFCSLQNEIFKSFTTSFNYGNNTRFILQIMTSLVMHPFSNNFIPLIGQYYF
jgi:hypothetical protein